MTQQFPPPGWQPPQWTPPPAPPSKPSFWRSRKGAAVLLGGGLLAAVVIVGNSGSDASRTPSGAPRVTASAAATITSSATADRAVCIDLDARGGALYNVLVVPMMTGSAEQKSISVDPAQMVRAAASVEEVGRGSIGQASPAVADAAQRMTTSAGALGVYAHADSTALLTSFVTLAVECQKAGHKPSWFDAASLVGS